MIMKAFVKKLNKNTNFNEKLEKKYEENFYKWLEYDLLTAIIAMLGLALSIVNFEYSNDTAKRIVLQ